MRWACSTHHCHRHGSFRDNPLLPLLLCASRRVYSKLKYESGVHRVQRVPATETSGRVHTSTATVAIMPEVDDVDVKIDPKVWLGWAGNVYFDRFAVCCGINHARVGRCGCEDRSQGVSLAGFAMLHTSTLEVAMGVSINHARGRRCGCVKIDPKVWLAWAGNVYFGRLSCCCGMPWRLIMPELDGVDCILNPRCCFVCHSRCLGVPGKNLCLGWHSGCEDEPVSFWLEGLAT